MSSSDLPYKGPYPDPKAIQKREAEERDAANWRRANEAGSIYPKELSDAAIRSIAEEFFKQK